MRNVRGKRTEKAEGNFFFLLFTFRTLLKLFLSLPKWKSRHGKMEKWKSDFAPRKIYLLHACCYQKSFTIFCNCFVQLMSPQLVSTTIKIFYVIHYNTIKDGQRKTIISFILILGQNCVILHFKNRIYLSKYYYIISQASFK